MMGGLVDQFGRPVQGSKPRPDTRPIYLPSVRDRWATYPSRGLTPARLARLLREADDGMPERQAELFREVEEKDAHISSQLHMRKQAVLGLEYDLQPASDDARAQKVMEFCREVLWGLEDLDDLLLGMLDAVPQGWSMHELLWEIVAGRAVIIGWRWVPQERTRWDDAGVPRLATDEEQTRGVEIPAWKVVYHRHKARSGLDVRAGVMRTCAWWWMFKNYAVKDWAAFCELFGMPLRYGTYPNGASEDDKQALKQALLELGSDGAAIVSEGTKLEFVEAKATGGGQLAFERLAAFCDRACSKAILGQTLTSDQGQVGSYGAAKVHDEVRLDLRDADAYALEKTLRQQVLQPLAVFNFGADAPVPWFRFAIQAPENLAAKSKMYQTLQGMGLPLGLTHIYDAFGVPAPEAGEELLGSGAEAPAGPADTQAKANRRREVNSLAAPAGSAQAAVDSLGDSALAQAAGAADSLVRRVARSADVAFSSLEELLDSAPRVLLQQNLTALAQPLARAALAARLDGLAAVLDDSGAAPRPVSLNHRFANRRPIRQEMNATAFLAEPLEPSEALDFFGRRAPVSPEIFAALSEDARQMAFTVAGIYREDVLSELYRAVDQALRDGSTLADFQARAGDIFAARGLAGPKPWHLETVFRGQLQSAYSAGRYQQMAAVAGSRPYWRYQAVMDAATRPVHAAQHGKVYQAGHPFWARWYPPNGFNCRCDVQSLSEGEVQARGYRVETRGTDDQPDQGWAYNVGEAGWGRGLVEAALGGYSRPGGWRYRPDLVPHPDRPGVLPAPAPAPKLPDHPEDLLRALGSPEAVRQAYRRETVQALGLGAGADGELLDLPFTDARGDGAVLAGRTVDHVLANLGDLARGRYLPLARKAVEQADEIWLVPGATPDGRISLRRYYIKAFESGEPEGLLAVAEFQRGVWEAFNALPLSDRTLAQKRTGLLLFGRQP
ncbi:MAG: DUF935 family protein [Desulfarculus sp.]|nr:DUF935 family protein [Desulfarculus sp.]